MSAWFCPPGGICAWTALANTRQNPRNSSLTSVRMIILCADGTAAIDAILAVLQHSGRLSAKSSKLWEKLIVAWWKFDGLSFEDNRRIPCRMLKMARLLTRPTL